MASRLAPTIHFRAMGDAGFFLNHPTAKGQQVILPAFQSMFEIMNSTYGVNDACIRGMYCWIDLRM